MDARNRFHTRATYALVRADYVALLLFMSALVGLHWRDVDWLAFTIAFAWIDMVGYLPGALWYRYRANSGREPVPVTFVYLYNFAHSLAVNLGLVVAWRLVSGRFEWAMLAAPIHLCIDWGVFGNIFKSAALSFEPVAHPEFSAFSLQLEQGGRWRGWPLKPPASRPHLDAVRALVREFSDHPSIDLVFNRDTEHYLMPELRSFVAYRRAGRTLFCLGQPVGPRDRQAAALGRFLAFAEELGRDVVALQVREDHAELFVQHGFRVNQMGRSYTLALRDFSLAGGRFMKLRNKIKQPVKAGVLVRELTQQDGSPEQLVHKLNRVTSVWLDAKGTYVKELRFLVGELASLGRPETRCFAAFQNGEIIAFITYVPSFGKYAGYMHDLTRRLPDAPPGVLESINYHAIEQFRSEGVEYLNFGLTPLTGIDDRHPSHSPRVTRILRTLAARGQAIYPSQSQEAYKMKWSPQHIEPEYLAFRGDIGLTQLWGFLRLTRSI